MIARAFADNHKHIEGGVTLQFRDGFLSTKNPDAIALLKKYNGKYWIIQNNLVKSYPEHLTRYQLVAMAIQLGFNEKTGENPAKSKNSRLKEFIADNK